MLVRLNGDDDDDDDNGDDQRRGIGGDGGLASTTNSHPSPSCSILCNTHNTNHGLTPACAARQPDNRCPFRKRRMNILRANRRQSIETDRTIDFIKYAEETRDRRWIVVTLRRIERRRSICQDVAKDVARPMATTANKSWILLLVSHASPICLQSEFVENITQKYLYFSSAFQFGKTREDDFKGRTDLIKIEL
ncbi:hypothetical protein V1478_004752 [Vespula squamosa]|uniref:Uncharacterized protein n=1 Tax=Vespula squamosa TaxID=30214 RepID=A0ABD2BH26_VESSQ